MISWRDAVSYTRFGGKKDSQGCASHTATPVRYWGVEWPVNHEAGHNLWPVCCGLGVQLWRKEAERLVGSETKFV